MAVCACVFFPVLKSNSDPSLLLSSLFSSKKEKGVNLGLKTRRLHTSRRTKAVVMLSENPVMGDLMATALSGGIALSILRLWEETAKREVFDQKTNRKLVHISIGLVFMFCWPMFSSGHQGAILAALIPGLNIIKMLLLGLGIWKDDATVKSMSRFGDHRELLKGPLYYALTITYACAVYWRYSPISIGLICNLCAGDGIADIVGRRFGKQKLPYNKNKSFAGSLAMATVGFLASIGYLHYFSLFGYIQVSSRTVLGFLFVSLAAALVESHPLSTELDDNLTVPLTSVLFQLFVIGKELWCHIDGSDSAPTDPTKLNQWKVKDAQLLGRHIAANFFLHRWFFISKGITS